MYSAARAAPSRARCCYRSGRDGSATGVVYLLIPPLQTVYWGFLRRFRPEYIHQLTTSILNIWDRRTTSEFYASCVTLCIAFPLLTHSTHLALSLNTKNPADADESVLA
jgi:hypothetical protein